MEKSLILFDFDGVFVDSANACVQIVQKYDPAFSREDLKELFMGNIYHTIHQKSRAKEPEGFDFQELYKPLLYTLEPFAGAKQFLENLNRTDNIIVSSTRSDSITDFLKKHNLLQYFHSILGGDVSRSKEEKFHKVMAEYPGRKYVFVTDTVGDIIEGEKFNMYTIGVTWGYHEKERLLLVKPDITVDSFDILLTLLI